MKLRSIDLVLWLGTVLIWTTPACLADEQIPNQDTVGQDIHGQDIGGQDIGGQDALALAKAIRPILSDHCFACHGPDEHDRQAGLRLDTEDGLASVVDLKDIDSSELIARLVSDDPDVVMPPPEYNKPISSKQRETIRQWIAAGATFQSHWAFQSPVKAAVSEGTENAIDYFVGRAIEREGLTPNGQAEDHALLRRVCLDLTGLPPTREQIKRLGEGPLDYDALVDELLGSKAFGQHFGRYWLDLVRYADTHGLHLDNYREMWPYRDWVIDAVTHNMPFDQFVTEQLAGDLLPEATRAQKIASGYNRLNVTTSEGGSIYDEVFARNVIDRTDAFGTVFMGLTTQCAVCHDHKFDPITQKDYYSLFAFFNSLDGRALDGNKKDHPPVVKVPSQDQEDQLKEYDNQIADLRKELRGDLPTVDAAQRAWEQSLTNLDSRAKLATEVSVKESFTLIPVRATADSEATLIVDQEGTVTQSGEIAAKDTHVLVAELPNRPGVETVTDGSVQTDLGTNWQTIELHVLPDPSTGRSGVSGNGNAVLTEIVFETRRSKDQDDWTPLSIQKATADIEQTGGSFAVDFAIDNKLGADAGWAINGHGQNGPRRASFAVPELAKRIHAGDQQIRVQLKYQSQFSKHQFYGVRLSLSNVPVKAVSKPRIEIGELYSVGPFPVESEAPAFSRNFASQDAAFKSDETFTYQGKPYAWEKRDDWSVVDVIDLPAVKSGVSVNVIHQSIQAPEKTTIDLLLGTSDGHSIYLNQKRIADSKRTGILVPLQKTYKLELKKGANDLLIKVVSSHARPQWTYAFRSDRIASPASLSSLASIPVDKRTARQASSLRKYYRDVVCDHPDWTALKDLLAGTQSARDELSKSVPTTLVWKELPKPREAKMLIRGQYDQPGETVARNTPGFLPPMPDDARRDRLGLAQWLISPEHPLTARVAVNRYWQSIFGSGLVKSSEDFGNQGELPSHQELLDWLAVDFRENGWDVKRLIRQIVTSETYRRGNQVRSDDFAKDPENRFLARGPRHRLDAEVLRDQALSLAGLLREDAGGPSVKPPQPKGLWYAVGYTNSDTANFVADQENDKIFRRSVYIFWKRTSAPPMMSTFDAPSRESCTARRERTNTPLQALLLMNEQQYLQSAKHMAARALTECERDDPKDKLAWLFETATARKPNSGENTELHRLLMELMKHYQQDEAAAKALLAVDQTVLESVPSAQHAAWTMIASTLINLDEVINK